MNQGVDIAGFATIIIYGVTATGPDKGVDAYVSCNDRGGNPFAEGEEDADGPAVHAGDGAFVEDPEDVQVAIVE